MGSEMCIRDRFYLRGIAPKEVKSSDIYLGALPWVGLQMLLVGVLVFFPEMVTGLLDKPPTGNLDAVEIRLDETPGAAEVPASGASSAGAGEAAPAQAPDPADYFNKK